MSLGALVRQQLSLEQGVWLVPPYLYIRHVEHVLGEVPILNVLMFIFAAGILTVLIARLQTRVSMLVIAAAALILGGDGGNLAELVARVAVTDYVGINPIGTFSAGDLAMDIGLSLMPVAVAAREQDLRARVAVGGGAYLVIALVGLLTEHIFEPALLTVVTGFGVAYWVWRSRRSGARSRQTGPVMMTTDEGG